MTNPPTPTASARQARPNRTVSIRHMLVVTLGAIALMVLIVWATSGEAAAQDAADAVVDLWPVVEPLIGVLLACLTALAGWAARWVVRKLKIEVDDRTRAYLNEGWFSALSYARQKLDPVARDLSQVEIRNQTIALATRYMVDTFPDGLRHFRITPDGVAERLTAKLEEFWPLPAGAPAAPDLTPAEETAR